MRRDADAYLYKDYGVNHFSGQFEHLIDVRVSALEAGDTSNRPAILLYAVANTYGTENTIKTSNYILVRVKQIGSTDNRYYFQFSGTGTGNLGAGTVVRFAGTTYYLTIKRATDNTCTCKIYTDSARTNLSETLTLPVSIANAFRYLTVTASQGDTIDPADHISGYVENLYFK